MEAGRPALDRSDTHDWSIRLDTVPRRLIAALAALVIFGFPLYRLSGPLHASWLVYQAKPDPQIYERAAALDPTNAEYHFVLAQLYNYSTQHLDPDRAGRELDAAIRLNPDRGSHWLEMSKFREQLGDRQGAIDAMKRAIECEPFYSRTRWAAANLYVRLGDETAADAELARAAALDHSYVLQVVDLGWKLYEDPARIVEKLLPKTGPAYVVALNYFASRKSDAGAALVMHGIKDLPVKASDLLGYVDYLIVAGRADEAYAAFSAKLPSPPSQPFNAGFESEVMQAGFDWRLTSSPKAEVRRDTATAKSGLASLLIVFDGSENPEFQGAYQWLRVEKGKTYNLRYWVRTESLTSSEGIFVLVDGVPSEKTLGSTSWKEISVPFTATADLVTISIRRQSSKKLDALIRGRAWFDEFSLVEQPTG